MSIFEMMVERPAGAQRVGPWWSLAFILREKGSHGSRGDACSNTNFHKPLWLLGGNELRGADGRMREGTPPPLVEVWAVSVFSLFVNSFAIEFLSCTETPGSGMVGLSTGTFFFFIMSRLPHCLPFLARGAGSSARSRLNFLHLLWLCSWEHSPSLASSGPHPPVSNAILFLVKKKIVESG